MGRVLELAVRRGQGPRLAGREVAQLRALENGPARVVEWADLEGGTGGDQGGSGTEPILRQRFATFFNIPRSIRASRSVGAARPSKSKSVVSICSSDRPRT